MLAKCEHMGHIAPMENSKISWTDHTQNFWIGCTNISPACDHCYAESLANRWKLAAWGAGQPRKRTSKANWEKPMLWNRHAAKTGTRPRVFSLSMGDWADAEVPEEWRKDMFDVVAATPHLEWLLLSKRHALVLKYLDQYRVNKLNVRIGFTVENQDMADIRMPRLHTIKAAGYKTFVSYEPALSAVFWDDWMDPERARCIDWLIAGGESGHGHRSPAIDWFRNARNACRGYDVPFHFKQWGADHPGNVLDGRQHLEFPR